MDQKDADNVINEKNLLDEHLAKINEIFGSEFKFTGKHFHSDSKAPQGASEADTGSLVSAASHQGQVHAGAQAHPN